MMNIPFTTGQFFEVIAQYNRAVFPFQLILVFLAVLSVALIHTKIPLKNYFTGSFLAMLWVWMGVVYHLAFFTAINPAAYAFGALFIMEGVLILIATFVKGNLKFKFRRHTKDWIAYSLLLFGLIIYPALLFLMEGSIYTTITTGLPCPSTIITFGFFILAGRSLPKYLLLIPLLWTLVGMSAAFTFGVYPDLMMPVAALITLFYLFKGKKVKAPAPVKRERAVVE